ncbi:ABC transporter ATP-binding protein [Paludisphaera borealis]|uniref:ABC transporter ATP-binding protein YtrB n=1 Tax=Paludisphaera borealis TaxID=1387353 RepID=A0A1U7CPB8_9BACT|nr:ABC transporter ATP-binding protein [Paludisphaera borealis]APW60784.1 ABC transporter ATP-binding protein YtrB [Paludisphaera borealis]
MTTEGVDGVIEVSGLSRRFGRSLALDGVQLDVPRGLVFGLVGENGAGKTTLIKHLLGLYRAQTGTVRVLGGDPVTQPVEVLSRIGYLSEDRDLPDWMRISELLNYLRAFYPTWDVALADRLRNDFDLDPQARIKSLSQGQRARVGLVGALAFRPDLLVLDEPSTGLDPIVRRDILAAIIRTIAEEGRTVFFSSHLLDEVERVADSVALIDRGRIVLSGPLDEIKRSHRRLTLRFDESQPQPPALAGTVVCDGFGRDWTAVCPGPIEAVAMQAAGLGGRIVEDQTPSLDEIFVAQVGSRRHASVEG